MQKQKQKFQNFILLLSDKYLCTLHAGGDSASLVFKLSSSEVVTVYIALNLDNIPAIKYNRYILIGGDYFEFNKLHPSESFSAERQLLKEELLDHPDKLIQIIDSYLIGCKNQ